MADIRQRTRHFDGLPTYRQRGCEQFGSGGKPNPESFLFRARL